MTIDIVVPTSGNIHNLQRLLVSIKNQTHPCTQVIVACNGGGYIKKDIIGCGKNIDIPITYIFADEVEDFPWDSGPGGSRQAGINVAKSEYVYCIDDDNILPSDFLLKTIALYSTFQKTHKHFILCPIVLYRDTGLVQSVGFDRYIYRQGRPHPITTPYIYTIDKVFENDTVLYPRMVGGNSFFGKTKDILTIGFDQTIQMTMEDIDRSMRATHMGYDLIVPIELYIWHHERDKTILEQHFVGNSIFMYHKTLNRIKFIKKYATCLEQWCFWSIGIWGVTLYTTLMIIRYATFDQYYRLIIAIGKGIKDGIYPNDPK